MASSTVAWGIEIGAYAIKALKIESEGVDGVNGTAKVVEFAVIPHKIPLSTPGTDPNDTVRVSLGELVSHYEIGAGVAVAMSVPGHSAFARFAKLPPVEPKKIPDIVKFEAVQQIPFPLEQVEWDYQTFANEDSPDVEVGIFAITRERIMERLALYEDVNIVPDCVTLSPVAAFNAMAFDLGFTERSPGTIILDIGTTSTDLVISEAGRVWIRTFPIGGHHFTEALVNAFQLSYAKAEKLKKEAESSKHARHIFQAMRPIFGDLAQDVQRSIGFYQSLHRDAKLERLIGLGSTFRLPGLRKYLKQQVGMDVFRLEQFKRLTMDGPRAGELQANTLNLATAYGLALQGLGLATLEANLMPTTVLREAMWQRKVKWFGVAAGVAVAASGAMFIRPFLDSQAVAAEPPPQSVRDAISEAQRLKSAASDVTNATIENSAAAGVLALLESRDVYAHLVNDVGQMMKHAQDRAPNRDRPEDPVFSVKSLKTSHVRSQGGGMDPNQPYGAAQPEVDTRERIQVTMMLTTNHADPQRLAFNTIDEWLRRNAKRQGVPYEIIVANNPSRLTGTTEVEAPALAAGTPGGDGIAGAGAPQQSGMRGGRFGGGQPMGEGGVMQTGTQVGASGAPPRQEDPADSQAAANVKKLAPLAGPPADPPGTKTSTFEVKFEVVLLPKQGGEGGGL
jgi:type IV pilus assembly protein PilM